MVRGGGVYVQYGGGASFTGVTFYSVDRSYEGYMASVEATEQNIGSRSVQAFLKAMVEHD